MQEAIPYRSIQIPLAAGKSSSPTRPSLPRSPALESRDVAKMVEENAVIVFGIRGCCMCHVVRKLLLGHGVNPPVFEIGEGGGDTIIIELSRVEGDEHGGRGEIGKGGVIQIQLPAVFVGGKLLGGLDRVMSAHISGELVPILKKAGALWL